MTISELMKKDVVNVCNAENYGRPHDFEIDICTGQICSIITADTGLFCISGKSVEIPWDRIIKIGENTILVELAERECVCDSCRKSDKGENKKHRRLFF